MTDDLVVRLEREFLSSPHTWLTILEMALGKKENLIDLLNLLSGHVVRSVTEETKLQGGRVVPLRGVTAFVVEMANAVVAIKKGKALPPSNDCIDIVFFLDHIDQRLIAKGVYITPWYEVRRINFTAPPFAVSRYMLNLTEKGKKDLGLGVDK